MRKLIFVCLAMIADVKMLNNSIKDAYRIIFGDKVTDTVRKKKRIVLTVRFICYLFHVIEG